MAEIVLGLAKLAVEGTLSKVKSAMDEDAELKVRVQDDLVFMTDEFQMMRSVLDVANEERAKDNVARTWVRQVRDLAYGVEDCIEYVVDLDNDSSRWWRLLPPCMAPARSRTLDDAVDELKRLKAKVKDVSERSMRYSLISNAGSEPKKKQPAATVTAAFDILSGAREAPRKRRDIRDLTELITGTNGGYGLGVISVRGTGGDLGTTYIIRKMYDDPDIRKSFENRAWIKVMHPFNSDEFLRSLMTQFYVSSCEDLDVHDLLKMEDNKLMNHFVKEVQRPFLLVLEGLSTMVEWDAIRIYLPDRGNRSRVVVSTQHLGIARLCTGEPCRVSGLKEFAADESICVFFKEVMQNPRVKLGKKRKYAKDFQHDRSKGKEALGEISTEDEVIDSDRVGRPELVGREREVYELARHLHRRGARVTSVWGIPGVGKSALVRSVFRRYPKVKNLGRPIWVDVPNPFSLGEFSRLLLSGFHSETRHIIDPVQECCLLLRGHICSVVIDNLRSMDEWDVIKAAFLSKPTQASIVVITNEASVATYCADGEHSVFRIKCLQAVAAVDLFIKAAGTCEREHAELIVPKCGGIPRVLMDVGSYLATATSHSLGVRFMGELETKLAFDGLRGLIAWMHSFFRNCPDSLKPYIYYLSVFPTDKIIRRRRLVRRWIAEGYLGYTAGSTEEEVGCKFFSKLVDLSIIQQPPLSGSPSSNSKGMINGFFREYMVSRPVQEKLVFALDERCNLTSQHKERHLAIASNWDRENINAFESIDVAGLRSLTVFGKWKSFFISGKMRLLRVLDLEDTSDVADNDVEKIGKLLPRLRFLSLRGCKGVRCLPSSLGGMSHLQTLDVRQTSIDMLPPAIIKLHKLQYIRAGTTEEDGTVSGLSATVEDQSNPRTSFLLSGGSQPVGGVKVPKGLGRLTSLHTLGVVNVNVGWGKAILNEFKKLTQLRKLGVSGINSKNSQKLCSAISGHGHLESLSVRFNMDKDGSICWLGDISQCPENLKNLKLYGLAYELPVWVKQLHKIRMLDLEITKLSQENIQVLADMPCLERLCVKSTNDELYFRPRGEYEEQRSPGREVEEDRCPRYFENLVVLEIACSSSLGITFGESDWDKMGKMRMKSLELLKVHCCSGRLSGISGTEHLPSLREVSLFGSFDDELKHGLQRQLEEHPREVKPVLKLEEIRRPDGY